jgi:hypothetical protein
MALQMALFDTHLPLIPLFAVQKLTASYMSCSTSG